MPWRFQRYTWVMKPPLFIRPITDDERMPLEADRRTADAFRVRRAQIVLASARGLSPKPIAQLVGCSVQTRMDKIIMRPRVRSISGARQVVHGTESCHHSRLPGWIAETAERCPSPDDCAPDDNGPHTH